SDGVSRRDETRGDRQMTENTAIRRAFNIRQYDLSASLQRFLEEKTGIPCDLIYDGYKMRDEKPFITVEQMQGNTEINVKGREAIESIYRYQVGLHASNPVERMKEQERISDLFLFIDIPYYNHEESTEKPVGFFNVELDVVMPVTSDDITDQSGRHTVYFDIEIMTTKRGC